MAKINTKTLEKNDFYNYFETTIDKIWEGREIDTKICFSDERTNMKLNRVFLKKRLPAVNKKLEFIRDNKNLIAEKIIEDNFLAFLDNDNEKYLSKPFKFYKNKEFFTQLENYVKSKLKKVKIAEDYVYSDCNEELIYFPITKEEFTASLDISDVEIFLEEEHINIELRIRCSPDYFAEHFLVFYVDNENNMKVMNFISDDEIGYEDENFYPIEYDDNVDYVGDVDDIDDIDDFDYNPLDHFSEILLSNLKKGEEIEETVKKFIDRINSHKIRSISSLMSEDFIYIDSEKAKDKKEAKEEFKNIFSIFPDYKIEIAELSMVDSSKVFVYSLVNNIPVVFIATISNKKIKCWEVFQYGRLS